MRKKLVCLLFFCIWLPLFAACGMGSSSISSSDAYTASATDSKESASVSFSWWGNPIRGSGTLKMLDEYSEVSDGITVVPYMTEWSDYWPTLATNAAGHILTDVIQMDYYYLNQFADKELLLDLSPYIKSGLISNALQTEEAVADWIADGKVLAVSAGASAPALIYNKTLLDSLGIEVKDRMTIDEFIGISRQVFAETGVRTNIAYGVEGYLEYFCRAYDELLYEQNHVGASVETLEKYYGLYEQARSEGWLIDQGAFSDITIGSVEQDPLLRRDSPDLTSWCDFAYSYQMYAVRKVAPSDMELGIVSWPSDHPEKSAYVRPGPALSVSVDAADPEEAAKLIGFMTDPEQQLSDIHGERGIPYSLLNGEEDLPVSDISNRMVLHYLKEIVMPVAKPINPPAPPWAGQAYSLNGSLVERISYGECDARTAAREFLQGCREGMD